MEVYFKNEKDNLKREFFEALFSKIYELNKEDNINRLYDLFKKKFLTAKSVYASDLSAMNDYDFNMFAHIYYNINLDINDYIDIYGKANNKKYFYINGLNTNIYTEVPIFKNIDMGIHSPWVLTPVKLGYRVLMDDSIKFNSNKEYSVEELCELVKNKNVIILESLYNDVDINNKNVNFVDELPFKNGQEKDDAYYREFINKLRLVLTDKRKLEDLKKYLLNFKKELDDFLSNMPYIVIQKEIVENVQKIINESEDYSKLKKLIAD